MFSTCLFSTSCAFLVNFLVLLHCRRLQLNFGVLNGEHGTGRGWERRGGCPLVVLQACTARLEATSLSWCPLRRSHPGTRNAQYTTSHEAIGGALLEEGLLRTSFPFFNRVTG